MTRITYDEIWQSEQPWPDGPAILSTVVRFQRGRAPILIYLDARRGTLGLQMPVLLDEHVSLTTVEAAAPSHLRPVLLARCTHALSLWYDFDVDAVKTWAASQPVCDGTRATTDARLMQVERERALRGDPALWEYLAEAFALDPRALPPLATARTGRYWSAQVSLD